MRMSVDKDSPDFNPDAWHATAFMDGVELVGCCILADDELGECIVHAMDDDGKHIMVDGKVMTKTIHGKVEIILAS